MLIIRRISTRSAAFVAGLVALFALTAVTAAPASAAYPRGCYNVPGWGTLKHPTGVQILTIPHEVRLYPGAFCQIGKSQLIFQYDGNLVLYDENGRARW